MRRLTNWLSLAAILLSVAIWLDMCPVVTAQGRKSSSISRAKAQESNKFLDNNYQRINEAHEFTDDEGEVHPNVQDSDRCNTCHEVFSTDEGRGSFIVFRENPANSLTAKCLSCHHYHVGDHPVLVGASFPIPKDLPVSDKNEITCITCHNPHYQRYSNRSWQPRSYKEKIYDIITGKKRFKTYFLRRNNAKKDLCLSCHKGVYQQRTY